MALQHLTDQQIRTWTRARKDEWWFRNVYRGDVPQLTLRSGLTGFLLGGVLAATGLYIAAKTGLAIGVGLTSVILSFALFRILHAAGLGKDLTILENNCTQSIAAAAGYMTTPLVASLTAYMLVTGRIIPWWQMLIWMVTVATTGVLVAFPLKRRFMKNYIVVRNLVANPRTPIDLSLGLMKNLLAPDLKNISANKEVSETIRKLAMKMYKQKLEAMNKK